MQVCEQAVHRASFNITSLFLKEIVCKLSTLLNVTWGWLGQVDTISMGYIDSLFQLAPLSF